MKKGNNSCNNVKEEKKENSYMKESNELILDDYTDVTSYIHRALGKINTIFKSSALTEEEKSRLGKLGRSIHSAGHEIDHLFHSLELVPSKLKDELRAYYDH